MAPHEVNEMSQYRGEGTSWSALSPSACARLRACVAALEFLVLASPLSGLDPNKAITQYMHDVARAEAAPHVPNGR